MKQNSGSPKVKVFTSSHCPNCNKAKALLKKFKVPFQEWNVTNNRRAQKELERLGARAVPVIQIGERIIRGFDAKKIRAGLKSSGFEIKEN